MDKLQEKVLFLENEIKTNENVYFLMKSSYSNIFGYGDLIINEYLDNLYNNINIKSEIMQYPYLIEDMYYIYTMRCSTIPEICLRTSG